MPKGQYDHKSLHDRFMQYVDDNWQWTGCKTKSGYGRIGIDYKTVRAHRVSYELFKGPIPDGMYVLHSCDDPGCVNPDHLHLGTAYENRQEMLSRNRSNFAYGEKHGRAKLSEDQVKEIKKKAKAGQSKPSIAAEYAICKEMVYNIIRGTNWKHLK